MGGRSIRWVRTLSPTPQPEAEHLRDLLRNIGVETGTEEAGRAQYDPSVVCRAPVERHR